MYSVCLTGFWVSLGIVFYTYLGYGLLLYVLIQVKRKVKGLFHPPSLPNDSSLPAVTLIIAAYNEEAIMEEKINNCFELDYPADKLSFLFITDGSDDQTVSIIKKYPRIGLLHEAERKGKIAAQHRAILASETSLLIFTDANTFLNPAAIRNIVRHYETPEVGAVAGEKRVLTRSADTASGAGEGIYWRYESLLKKWDSELFTVVGAAGELFSIRRECYEPVPEDTIVEDFVLTTQIAQRGYKVRYEPEATASEQPSDSVKEELKRKIRIAAGGIQAFVRFRSLLNPFKYGLLSFQYISHRALRWTLGPLCLALLFVFNLGVWESGIFFYQMTMLVQLSFYALAALGAIFERHQVRVKAFFIPYYFCVMNYAIYAGFIRYIKGNQSVKWERAKRRE